MILWLAYLASIALATAMAAWWSDRCRGRIPIVSLLGFGLVSDILVGKRGVWGLGAVLTVSPHVGWHLPLYHLSNALVSAWPAAVAVTAWWVFGWRRWALLPAVPWVALNVALVRRYPFSEEVGQRALLVGEWLSLILASIVLWRSWGRVRLGSAQQAIRMLLAVEFVVVTLGPFRGDIYRDWDLARFAYLLGFVALSGWIGSRLRRFAR